MKKLLISLVIALILILTAVTVINGLHVGNISILGIKEIKDENAKLETKIEEATKLASTTYPSKLTSLDTDLKDMKSEKEKYEDMVATSTQSEIRTAMQEQTYTIDKLWTKIGTLATDEGLDATFKLEAGTRVPIKVNGQEAKYKYYNVSFILEGGYANISLYISDLENDSELGFKIENFKMEPIEDGTRVKATFTCKDIAIEGISTSTIQTEEQKDENNANTTNTNTTNTNTTNTTNKTGNTSTLNNIANATNTVTAK